MRNFRFPFRVVPSCYALIGVLVLSYIIAIAVVMSYATLTIEFTQSVRNDTSAVASLEKQYLSEVAALSTLDYTREGYAKPETKLFVRAKSGTALR